MNLKKQKLRKQLEQEKNHRNEDHMEGYQQGGGRMGRGEVQGIRSIVDRCKTDGDIKTSIGNEEARESICTTHGHELRDRGNAGGNAGTGRKRIKGRENNGTTIIV